MSENSGSGSGLPEQSATGDVGKPRWNLSAASAMASAMGCVGKPEESPVASTVACEAVRVAPWRAAHGYEEEVEGGQIGG